MSVVIADFGLAVMEEEDKKVFGPKCFGTVWYQAPEVIAGRSNDFVKFSGF
jgi:serine/threonine protein kinase